MTTNESFNSDPFMIRFSETRSSSLSSLDSNSIRFSDNYKIVTFCAIRVEIVEGAPDLDIYFNRGKTLEDLFDGLTVLPLSTTSPTDPETMERIKKNRGRREAGEVRVETFTDLDKLECEKNTETNSLSKSSCSGETSKESTPVTLDQIKFKSGNPFVEVTKGVLHLYKENQATSLEPGVLRSEMLCMLGVPAKIKTMDILQFTAPCHSSIEMMKVIQDSTPNQYMVLLKFNCQESADEFYQAFNGQKFNSFEADVCSLVYVSKVETCKESEYCPMGSHTELPVCSICLERMDESISTVLTILCNHKFHGSCLAQWEDSTCPVCRCVQTPEVEAEQRCSDCQSSEDLWICLICGYVGCGRYVGGHSHAHFIDTSHCYTMELGQNRVWDYVGDNFVHRLVQTDNPNGKLVETEGNGSGSGSSGRNRSKGVDGVNVDSEAKMDSIQLEYTYLLTSQLEAQRRHYEEKISLIEDHSLREIAELQEKNRAICEETKTIQSKFNSLSKEKQKSDSKLAQTTQKMKQLLTELVEEKQMNESLRTNQSEWQNKLTNCEEKLKTVEDKKDKEILDLSEQLRDMMFYFEAQNTIANSGMKDEIQEGEVILPAQEPTSNKSTGAKSKSRKKKAK